MRAALAVTILLFSGCTCSSTWLRSCGPEQRGWGVTSIVKGGLMVVAIESLPPGRYEVTAQRNGPNGHEVLARGMVTVTGGARSVRMVLEPEAGADVARDAFVVVARIGGSNG